MNAHLPPYRSQLFTVRLWLEDVGNGHVEWRGQVQHVISGTTLGFRDWPALIAWLVTIVGLAQLEGESPATVDLLHTALDQREINDG